jgi:DNA-binding transcriptional ArsR family regulator
MVESTQLDGIFHALSDATRRAILRDIANSGKTVGEIAEPYPISLAAVSKHIKVLEAAQLIERERRGSFQVVRLRATPLQAADTWLADYRAFWTGQLDRLQAHLEQDHQPEGEP